MCGSVYVLNAESGIGGKEVAKWKVKKTEGKATDNQGGAVVKNLPANAGDSRDAGSIPGSGRSPGVGNGSSGILVWRIIPWTEEPGRLQSTVSQRVGHK